MKKMKGIRILTAWTLAVMMICSCAGSALAASTDDYYISDPDNPDLTISAAENDVISIVVGSENPESVKANVEILETANDAPRVLIYCGYYEDKENASIVQLQKN